jgi:serine/threonine protein kinase
MVAEVLVDDLAQLPQAPEVFLAEARRWSAVRSDVLATPVGLGRTANGQPFSVGTALDGIPLASYIAQSQRFPPALVAAILHQLLDALAPLHRLGMSHGAIATTRISLVRRPTGSFEARLRGFGRRALANAVSRDAFDALSRLDAISFASPDVARGGASDDDADRWAVAVLAHELLTGRAPLGGPTPFARYQALVRQTSAPSLTLPGEAVALQDFFSTAFAPQRAARFASTDAMIEALLRAVTPRSGAPVAEVVPSIEAPIVTAPSAPNLEASIPSSARPAPTRAPSRCPGLESTLTSEAPVEVREAVEAGRRERAAAAVAVPERLGGTLRSTIDPAELDEAIARKALAARGPAWRDARVLASFAIGTIVGIFLGVLLVRAGTP